MTFLPSDGSSALPVLVNGEPEKVNEVRAKEILTMEDFELVVDLGMGGDGEAQYWTCDFSYVSNHHSLSKIVIDVFSLTGIRQNQWRLSQLGHSKIRLMRYGN